MTKQNAPGISPEELARRRAAIDDAISMSPHIPDELRARLEAGLSEEMRTAVLELQIIAIKYGRALERRDLNARPRIEMSDRRPQPSKLLGALLDRAQDPVHRVNEDKKVDILVAPGFLDLTKKD